MRKYFPIVFGLTFIAALLPSPVLAAGGSITSLSVSGGSGQGDTISISATIQATSKVNSSNLYYTIVAPDNVTIVATHSTAPPNMQSGDTFSDGWSTTNAGWPSIGTYTVTVCWSTGNAHNCNIDSSSTGFYSVPSLGWPLTIAGLALLLYMLWRRRKIFEPVAEGGKR